MNSHLHSNIDSEISDLKKKVGIVGELEKKCREK